jgi:hypothetical protein
MTSECRSLIQGTRMRATRLNECGEVVYGDCAYVVSEGFISVAMSDNVEDGDEFKQKTAGGVFCVNQRSLPLLNWIETAIEFCEVNPELFELVSGSPLVLDDSSPPQAVGFGTDSDSYASASFALEVWTNLARSSAGACVGGTRHGYLLLPWLIEGTIGDITIENGTVNFTVNNITAEGNSWGTGPYDVIVDSLGNPSRLLEPIPTNRHRHLQFTSLAPPDAACSCQELVFSS